MGVKGCRVGASAGLTKQEEGTHLAQPAGPHLQCEGAGQAQDLAIATCSCRRACLACGFTVTRFILLLLLVPAPRALPRWAALAALLAVPAEQQAGQEVGAIAGQGDAGIRKLRPRKGDGGRQAGAANQREREHAFGRLRRRLHAHAQAKEHATGGQDVQRLRQQLHKGGQA